MSAIFACWNHQKKPIKTCLQNMLCTSDYWNPDKKTNWLSDESVVGLAKAQLINTKNSLKDAVYHDKSARLTITANARIDNKLELIKQLFPCEQTPDIQSDSHLILECYKKWGRDCASFLRGDFVFIIWDEAQQKMFCARDHFGIKVLFYSKNEQGIMLSNEHNSFFNSKWCDPANIDEKWLVENIWNLGPLNFDSPNPNIQILPPAHTLEIDSEGLRIESFWRLQQKNDWQHLDDEELIIEFKKRFQQAVLSRLDSEFPIGAELSEGLDSNGIAGYAAKHLKPDVIYTFSYDCEAIDSNNRHIWEHTYKDIQGMLNMHNNLQPVWQSDTLEYKEKNLDSARQSFYQNFGVVIPVQDNFLRCLLAQQRGVQVILSGWGGDHCVTCPGDEYANELFQKGRLIKLYRLLKSKFKRGRGNRPIFGLLTTALGHFPPMLHLYQKLRQQSLQYMLLQRAKSHYLSELWIEKLKLDEKLKHFALQYQRKTVQQHEVRELFELGLTNRLTSSELMGRQYRIEYRFPMLDLDLVEFAHSLPSRLKIHQGIERYPFRRLLEGITTERIQWRRKADVSHPNIDRASVLAETNARLAKELKGSSIIAKYSSDAKLNAYAEGNYNNNHNLRFIVDFESHYK
jgi:asparagine synthase (glutamine-hydrolysing)